jgi:hypothetical protein
MKQNRFADFEDALMFDERAAPLVIFAGVFTAFIGFWIHFGSFWGAIALAALSGSVFGAGALLIVSIVVAIFSRRQY